METLLVYVSYINTICPRGFRMAFVGYAYEIDKLTIMQLGKGPGIVQVLNVKRADGKWLATVIE